MKFLFFSEYGEILDLATHLSEAGHEVLLYIKDKDHAKIGEGIVPKTTDWHLCIGEHYVWVFDSNAFGNLQDWLRGEGESVFGGCVGGDVLENDRQTGQRWFKEVGFYQPSSKNFTKIEDAIEFVEKNADKRWIIKQNADAPKSISYLSRFDGCVDLIAHLTDLQQSWNESELGKFDADLMEVVEGTEVGATAFFNGHQFMENREGKVIGFLDFEEKKEGDGGLGETTGEMGTVFVGVTENNKLFKDIILRPGITEKLEDIGFRGVFNINCIVMDDGQIVALEPTMRFGIPATSYECIEGMVSEVGYVLDAVARGLDKPIELYMGLGMALCVVAKPFPTEADVEAKATSIGERLWILDVEGQPRKDFTDSQQRHIHLYNFYKNDFVYKVATKSGYLLVVTKKGTNLKSLRTQCIEYVKSNLFVSGMKFRTDIGKRAEDFINKLLEENVRV